MTEATINRRRGWVVAVVTVIIAILVMVIGVAVATPANGSASGASSGDRSKVAAMTSEQVKATQSALTVTKVTPDQLEALTVEKYSGISQVFLDSSLSTKDKQRTESTGFSDALTFGFKASDDSSRFAELEEEIMRNPVDGVTVVKAIKDKKIGDRTIGSFNPWMEEMVSLHEKNGVSYWLEYRDGDKSTMYVTDEYRRYAATLCTFLERLVPQGVHAWQTVENWPLNGAANNNDRIGVPADYQYAKDALILAYVGKDAGADGNGGNAAATGNGLFVIGFNVHDKRPEFYGGTPEAPQPTPPASVIPTPDNPNPPTPTPTPTPTPDPDPKYNKDPNKAPKENTEPNDDPGPGPSTNNGVGAQESTADQPTNSNHMTYEEYVEEIAGLAETNAIQQTGNDSNQPSTPTPSGTTVDNNGGETINQPTTSPSNDKPADGSSLTSESDGAWGGPKD